jgi:prepilin-type N-terminal cleavage/methylation domain-containing protein
MKTKEFNPLEIPKISRQTDKQRLLLTGFTLIELLVVIAIIALLRKSEIRPNERIV